MKFLQLRLVDGLTKFLVLEFGHLAAHRANHVMMGFIVVRAFVLGRIAELMFDDQLGIDQKYNGIVNRCPTYPEFAFIRHVIIQRIDVEMALDGINGIEYSKAFRCLSMPVNLQVFCQDLLDCIFHIFFHPRFQFRRQS